jgi:hypothetical protein
LGSWEGQEGGGDRDDTIPNSIYPFVCWKKDTQKTKF